MALKFPNQYEGDLEVIKYFLDRHVFADKVVLKKYTNQLDSIETSIEETLKSNDPVSMDALEAQRKMVQNLNGKCHSLKLRKRVIDFAEAAESIANKSPHSPHEETVAATDKLREEINIFLREHRPSQTDVRFLRFAKVLLTRAEERKPVIERTTNGDSKKVLALGHFQMEEISENSYETAETLYELSSILYQEEIDKFHIHLKKSFSDEVLKEVRFHVSNCEGDLNDLLTRKSQLRTIQGLLGYSHLLTDYYIDALPYPTLIEIHEIFQDEELITHLESSDESSPMM